MTRMLPTTVLQAIANIVMVISLLQGCASRQGTHEGDLLDNKVTAQRIEAAFRKSGAEFRHIKVQATKDCITLTGTVKSDEEKTRAEALAKSVQREMDLKNELQVRE